jgi:hypothetical protein
MGAALCRAGGGASGRSVQPAARDSDGGGDRDGAPLTVDDHPAVLAALASAVATGCLDLSQADIALGAPNADAVLGAMVPQLSALPRGVLALHRLSVLTVRKSKLSALPPELGAALPALTTIDVSSNCLTGLPESLGALRALARLIVYKNGLTSLPASLGGCVSLVELNCFDNALVALPDGITQLEALEDVRAGSGGCGGSGGGDGDGSAAIVTHRCRAADSAPRPHPRSSTPAPTSSRRCRCAAAAPPPRWTRRTAQQPLPAMAATATRRRRPRHCRWRTGGGR